MVYFRPMSSLPTQTGVLSTEPVFPLSVAQYHAMIASGVLADDDPVELLEGVLVFKMPKNPRHRLTVRLLTTAIDAILPPGWHFCAQEPLTLADGEPEPDGCIARGNARDYADRHPQPVDVAVVIEVTDTTQSRDRGIKLHGYARAEIPVYWIVDLEARRIEVHTEPDARAQPAVYRQRQYFGAQDAVPVVLQGQIIGTVKVAEILP